MLSAHGWAGEYFLESILKTWCFIYSLTVQPISITHYWIVSVWRAVLPLVQIMTSSNSHGCNNNQCFILHLALAFQHRLQSGFCGCCLSVGALVLLIRSACRKHRLLCTNLKCWLIERFCAWPVMLISRYLTLWESWVPSNSENSLN